MKASWGYDVGDVLIRINDCLEQEKPVEQKNKHV
jgi:hypothetical protein